MIPMLNAQIRLQEASHAAVRLGTQEMEYSVNVCGLWPLHFIQHFIYRRVNINIGIKYNS